jgi:hypothetical protein
VQRLLAALLLSVIGFLPVAADLASVAHSPQVPACCLAHGKHKCAVRSGFDAAPAIFAPCDKYPFLPAVSSTALNASLFATGIPKLFLGVATGCRVAPVQAESRSNILFEGGRQKRGPPALLS